MSMFAEQDGLEKDAHPSRSGEEFSSDSAKRNITNVKTAAQIMIHCNR